MGLVKSQKCFAQKISQKNRRNYDLSKKNWPSCLPKYFRFFCFDLSKLCEIRKQLEIIYPALLSISFYLYSFRNKSVLKMHMHFGWGKNVQEHPEEDPEPMEDGAPTVWQNTTSRQKIPYLPSNHLNRLISPTQYGKTPPQGRKLPISLPTT